jgi:hypothetical protein
MLNLNQLRRHILIVVAPRQNQPIFRLLPGRAISQAVSRRFVAQVMSFAKSGTVLRFPLPILMPPTAPHSSIIWGWYNRPISGRSKNVDSVSTHPKFLSQRQSFQPNLKQKIKYAFHVQYIPPLASLAFLAVTDLNLFFCCVTS